MGRDPLKSAALLAATLAVLVGCDGRIPSSPLEKYHLVVATVRASYAAGDSVFVRITNGEAIPFVWHRCPGIMLQRKANAGWTELTDDDTCSPGEFSIPGGESLTVVFVMPAAAPAGRYRVQARLSAIDQRPPLFWWPSPEFAVTEP